MAHLLAGRDIEDLRASVASSSNKAAVLAEANTAHHALVSKIVHEIDVQATRDTRVEDSVPVLTLALEVRWELVGLELTKLIADLLKLEMRVLEVWSDDLVLVRWL